MDRKGASWRSSAYDYKKIHTKDSSNLVGQMNVICSQIQNDKKITTYIHWTMNDKVSNSNSISDLQDTTSLRIISPYSPPIHPITLILLTLGPTDPLLSAANQLIAHFLTLDQLIEGFPPFHQLIADFLKQSQLTLSWLIVA